jgi:hypothetical protein
VLNKSPLRLQGRCVGRDCQHVVIVELLHHRPHQLHGRPAAIAPIESFLPRLMATQLADKRPPIRRHARASGVEDARERAYVAGIHALLFGRKSWMAGTRPAMTPRLN